MKNFFSYRFEIWKSPLEIFPLFSGLDTHLFFSGDIHDAKKLENPENSGKYSFIMLTKNRENIISFKNNINNINTNKKIWKHIQNKFLEISSQYQDDTNLKNWKFPFCGGLAGVFSYDFVRVFQNLEYNANTNSNLPLASLQFCERFFAFDHVAKEFFVAGWFENQEEADVFFEKMIDVCRDTVHRVSTQTEKTPEISGFFPEISEQEYQKKFQICQDELENGKSFQINFSQKFLAQTSDSAWDIFVRATKKNPAQMMYFHEQWRNDFSVISCSPERLFSCDRNQKIFTQPIAGTRPRGKNLTEEQILETELTTSPKEVSEHSMIVDLLRNDFGKVSEFGSVKVEKFMRVEKYATVMHLVSDISGKIASDKNIFDVFESLFPGGTITGAPKVETMKILAREEISSRNFYCGSAGYFSFCGSADWNILIRTLEKEGEKISGRAGGGLVFGANPINEYQECLHKFSGLKKIFE